MTTRQEERDARLIVEATRVYRRYAIEIVEGLGFCPWAARARKEGQTREVVLLDDQPNAAASSTCLRTIDAIAAADAIDIGLVIFPRLRIERLDFERFVSDVRTADETRARPGRPALAMAAFHPDAQANTESAARLTPFVRRTPDPTIQLVRVRALDRVRADEVHGSVFVDARKMTAAQLLAHLHENAETPAMHERIARANLATVEELGVAEVTRKLDDIRNDRDASYARVEADG